VAGSPRPRAIRGFAALGNLSPNVAFGSRNVANCFSPAAKKYHRDMGKNLPKPDIPWGAEPYGQKIETIAKLESYAAEPRRLERWPCRLSSVILEATTGALVAMAQRGH
jgi:hypothetical protein